MLTTRKGKRKGGKGNGEKNVKERRGGKWTRFHTGTSFFHFQAPAMTLLQSHAYYSRPLKAH